MNGADAIAAGPVGGYDPRLRNPRLRNPRHRVARRAIGLWMTKAAFGWLIFVVAQLIVWVTVSWAGWLLVTGIVSSGIGLLDVVIVPWWRYRVHRWEVSEDAVYTLQGWLNLEWRVAPSSRIQTVDTARGVFERLFGLATVTVTTASAAGHVAISGIDHELAARLVEDLTARSQDEPGDAT